MAEPRFFFVHVMKTAGATFRQHIYGNFDAGAVYPDERHDDMYRANTNIPYLLTLAQERRDSIRAFTGHFPFVVSEMMGIDFVTLSILRDPIERTISYLKHCKRYDVRYRDRGLEEIYEDPFLFPGLIENHQAKIFSMTTDDRLRSYLQAIKIDDRRLELAKANVEKIDVLGLTEHYGEFLDDLEARFGWRFPPRPDRRVSREGWDVPPSMRARIAADNAADIEFYEHARSLYLRHQRGRSVQPHRLRKAVQGQNSFSIGSTRRRAEI